MAIEEQDAFFPFKRTIAAFCRIVEVLKLFNS
jgi:hypothetical protein